MEYVKVPKPAKKVKDRAYYLELTNKVTQLFKDKHITRTEQYWLLGALGTMEDAAQNYKETDRQAKQTALEDERVFYHAITKNLDRAAKSNVANLMAHNWDLVGAVSVQLGASEGNHNIIGNNGLNEYVPKPTQTQETGK